MVWGFGKQAMVTKDLQKFGAKGATGVWWAKNPIAEFTGYRDFKHSKVSFYSSFFFFVKAQNVHLLDVCSSNIFFYILTLLLVLESLSIKISTDNLHEICDTNNWLCHYIKFWYKHIKHIQNLNFKLVGSCITNSNL